MIAHLCHPYQSANDNASGCSGAMETMCKIQKLMHDNVLEKPKKTIKMILVPEFTGTFFYLKDDRDISKIKYGINLDMIGAEQNETTGPINITNLPHSTPSYVDSFARVIATQIKSLSKEELGNVKYQDIPFGIGSDHFILSDPMVNIPCIMLGQWPDKHYHTSSDTINRIDPTVLKFSTVIASSYVYGLANFKEGYKPYVMEEMISHFISERSLLHTRKKDILSTYDFFEKSLRTLDYKTINLSHLQSKFIKFKNNFNSYSQIPIRKYDTPFTDISDFIIHDNDKLTIFNEYTNTHKSMQIEYALPQVLCDYYTDGIKTISQIAEYITCEFDDIEEKDIYDYFMMMKKLT